jgi:hypothetical protein
MKNYKRTLVVILVVWGAVTTVYGQMLSVSSPNHKINIQLIRQRNSGPGEWELKVLYETEGRLTEVIPQIDLGISRDDQDFTNNLTFLTAGKPVFIHEQYHALHGKKIGL